MRKTSKLKKSPEPTGIPPSPSPAKVEFFECRDNKNKPRQRRVARSVDFIDERKPNLKSENHSPVEKPAANQHRGFLQMSLDGSELYATDCVNSKILTLPRIETPEKNFREFPDSMAALRARTPPAGKTILDVSENFRLRNGVVDKGNSPVKAFVRRHFVTSTIKNMTPPPGVQSYSRPPSSGGGNSLCCEQCEAREDIIRFVV